MEKMQEADGRHRKQAKEESLINEGEALPGGIYHPNADTNKPFQQDALQLQRRRLSSGFMYFTSTADDF